MKLDDVEIGDHLLHNADPRLSGLVVGTDPVGCVRPVGPCIYLRTETRGWLRVGEVEIGSYTRLTVVEADE
jgi:hypothetical protein